MQQLPASEQRNRRSSLHCATHADNFPLYQDKRFIMSNPAHSNSVQTLRNHSDTAPCWVLDIDVDFLRALLYIPGLEPAQCPRFRLPAAAAQGNFSEIALATLAHPLLAQLSIPHTPSLALCREYALTGPENTAVTNKLTHMKDSLQGGSSAALCALRHSIFASHFATANGIELTASSLAATFSKQSSLQLSPIQHTLSYPVLDSFHAALLGIISAPAVASRMFRQGILAVKLTQHRLQAALVFQGRMLGFFEHPFTPALATTTIPATQLARLLQHLESFRLGWLPPEVAEQENARVAVCPQLPAEAEGFKPMYITGSHAPALQGYGQISSIDDDPAMTGCWGLIHALELEHSTRGSHVLK